MDVLLPLYITLMGLLGLALYVVTAALRDVTRKMTEMNEKLLVLLGTRDGGSEVGRALVASGKRPKKPMPGLSSAGKKPKKPQEGINITYGAV